MIPAEELFKSQEPAKKSRRRSDVPASPTAKGGVLLDSWWSMTRIGRTRAI